MSAQNNTTLDFSTIPKNLSVSVIWRQVLKDVPFSIKLAGVVYGGMSLFLTLLILYAALSAGAFQLGQTFYFLLLMFLPTGLIILSTLLIPVWKSLKKTRALARSSAFAAANGFQFIEQQENPQYPGTVFGIEEKPEALFSITGQYRGRNFRLFNYSYARAKDRNSAEFIKGVIILKLPRKVPNVVFDSKSNDSLVMDSLRSQFSASQRFTFEGDFNEHFDVYAPKHYNRDVLYFMTPELMALLIDKAGKFDIETVDDDLLFYAPGFKYTPEELADIFEVIAAVGGEFSENVTRYADERVGNRALNAIAPHGQRLKPLNITRLVAVVVILYTCLVVYTLLHDPSSPFHLAGLLK